MFSVKLKHVKSVSNFLFFYFFYFILLLADRTFISYYLLSNITIQDHRVVPHDARIIYTSLLLDKKKTDSLVSDILDFKRNFLRDKFLVILMHSTIVNDL